jgi:hypothetical protein
MCGVEVLVNTYSLTYSMEQIVLEKLTGFQLVKKFPVLCGTLQQSQVPATCPYPEADRSNPYPHISSPEDPS